jgi:hypothetical protein
MLGIAREHRQRTFAGLDVATGADMDNAVIPFVRVDEGFAIGFGVEGEAEELKAMAPGADIYVAPPPGNAPIWTRTPPITRSTTSGPEPAPRRPARRPTAVATRA